MLTKEELQKLSIAELIAMLHYTAYKCGEVSIMNPKNKKYVEAVLLLREVLSENFDS